jgi:hypothetical protein
MRVWSAVVADAACVVAFAAIGRRNHAEGLELLGVAGTAWPFLAGAAAGMLAGRIWRDPASLRSGLLIWLGTVIVGMLLRAATGGGIQLSFVLVAATVLAVFLLGWRLLARLATRTRRVAATPDAR